MGMVPRGRDIVDRQIDHESRIQFQEIRRQRGGRPFTVTHTLLLSGEVTAGVYVPPLIVEIDPLGDTPETKEVVGVGHIVRTGSVTIGWLHEETTSLFAGFAYDLAHGDTIRPVISAASGAADLSAYVTIRITPA